jgi:D-alanyl-D-alanine carboxypeptidase
VASLFGLFARLFGTLALLAVLAACATGPSGAAPYAAIVMDARTGETLYSKNADTRLHPASLTKMLTLYIAFEEIRRGNISLDTMVTVSKNAAAQPPSKLGLRAGQKIALRYLIRAAAVKSANDAASAIGDAIGGSESAFAKRMNRTAKAIGMQNSTFKNANGLTASGHLSTARDMNVLGRRLFYDFPEFYNIFSRRSTDAGMAEVANTNRKFLDAYKGADGIKTGYTNPAGFNLTASAERGKTRIIATIFGGQSTAQRNSKMAELLDLGFGSAPANAPVTIPAAPEYQGGDALVASAEPTFEDQPGGSAKTIRLIMAVTKSPRPMARPDATVTPEEIGVAQAIDAAMQEGIAGALAEATTPPPVDSLEAQSIALVDAAVVSEAPEAADATQAVDLALAEVALTAPPTTLDGQSQALASEETTPVEGVIEPAATLVAELSVATEAPEAEAIVVPRSAQNAPPARPEQPIAEPEVQIAAAEPLAPLLPEAIEDTAAIAPIEPEILADALAATAPLELTAPLVRPAKRNAPIFDAAAAPVQTAEAEQEVVTRVSTSGGRYWGVNVGRFSSSYEAERVLLKTQLAESATLNDGLRKVIQKQGGFDANFMGLSQEQADLACRRLQARAVQCFTIGP